MPPTLNPWTNGCRKSDFWEFELDASLTFEFRALLLLERVGKLTSGLWKSCSLCRDWA